MNLPDFSACRVLVAGDVMVDIAVSGAAARLSPEAPVPVLSGVAVRAGLGGAGNAAANCAGLGAAVTLLGIWGDPGAKDASVEDLAARHGIRAQRVHAPSTIRKTRFLADGHQFLRIDDDADLATHSANLSIRLARQLSAHDVLLLSDYGKGSLHSVIWMIEAARHAGVPVVVDPKGRDFSRYHGATLLKPNRAEFEAVVGKWRDRAHFVRLGEDLCAGLDLDALLVTEGADGMTLFTRRAEAVRIPAPRVPVHDVTGAGDSVAAVMACAIAVGLGYAKGARLAARAGAVTVSRPGTEPVSLDDLRDDTAAAILSPDAAAAWADRVRAAGERLVVANGCFDVLHAGHVDLLRHARSQGDRLLVAVNDDASVARIKGPRRPVNPLALRLEVLAALGCVDGVVAFSGDTPAALLAAVRPDVLVKGADWRDRTVAGAEHCGRVVFAPLRAGVSSSLLIERQSHASA